MTKLHFAIKAAAVFSIVAALGTASLAQGRKHKARTDRDRLIGTWHLISIDLTSPDGQPEPPLPIGLLIFTADGHEAVQLMYPRQASTLNNKFVHDGYEASFGTFKVDEANHLLRYRPVASATRDAFVGTEERLRPTFPDARHLVVRPADPDQHWSVTWERY